MRKRFLVFWLLSFCVGSACRARCSGARCCLPFLSSLFPLLDPVWRCLRGSVSSLFRGQGHDPRTDLSQVPPLSYNSGMDLRLYVLEHPLSFSLCLFPCSPEAFNSVEPAPSVEVHQEVHWHSRGFPESMFGRISCAVLRRGDLRAVTDSELVLSPLDDHDLWCSWRSCGVAVWLLSVVLLAPGRVKSQVPREQQSDSQSHFSAQR